MDECVAETSKNIQISANIYRKTYENLGKHLDFLMFPNCDSSSDSAKATSGFDWGTRKQWSQTDGCSLALFTVVEPFEFDSAL